MLLRIAYSFSDGSFLSFIEFVKLIVAVLEDAVQPEQLSESAKAEIVNELWKVYACGKGKPRHLR
jgi:hypothetical protein